MNGDYKRYKAGKNSFLVTIRDCRNQTWQGEVTWIERGEKIPFRSALELMRLIDSVVADGGGEPEDAGERSAV